MTYIEHGNTGDFNTLDDIPRLLLMNKRQLNKEIRRELRLQRRRGIPGAFDIYTGIKNGILGFPGKSVARFLKWKWPERRDNFCERTAYCTRVDEMAGWLNFFEKNPEVATLPASVAAERIPWFLDFLDLANEFASEFMQEVAENLLPVALIVKIFKFGMDEYCDCQ
ncbi:MAG: hypothetical protein ABJO27_09985 [Pseudoruegeria sp.]